MGVSFRQIPEIDLALGLALLVSFLFAVLTGRRGGRFRGLPGWAGFWLGFSALLVCLSRAPRWASFPLLALLMFATLRAYFFLAPVRPADRWAIISSYVAIPLVLYPAYIGSNDMFLATVPVSLFLLMPLMLALGPRREGLLDAMGRTLLGVLLFIFCTAHLGLLAHEPTGLPELFAVLVLAAELVQRLIGRLRPGEGRLRASLGILASAVATAALGFRLGPLTGLTEEDGARAGVLVALAVTAGSIVIDAVAHELDPRSSTARLGRGAFLDRMIPAVYAAPVFYHYLSYFG